MKNLTILVTAIAVVVLACAAETSWAEVEVESTWEEEAEAPADTWGVVDYAPAEGPTPVNCDLMELSPCMDALSTPTLATTRECCAKVIEQRPCFCEYMNNPFLKPYINSPNVKRIGALCRVEPPGPECEQ